MDSDAIGDYFFRLRHAKLSAMMAFGALVQIAVLLRMAAFFSITGDPNPATT